MILWLDLETYSEIDIKNGAYKYAEGAEIILFSYAIDDAPARVVDVAHGEAYPPTVVDAFNNPECICIAHNAQFDRTVLKKFVPAVANPRRWKDSMIKAYSLSLPGSLAALCEYCGLPVDKAKDKEGGMLVRKFCIPQKFGRCLPPVNDSDWQKFVNYARLDVEAMREVWNRLPYWNDLKAFWAEWHIDQVINDRGMQIDLELASCAIEASAEVAEKSNATVQRITEGKAKTAGQRDVLMRFLEGLGYDVKDMRKSTLEHALDDPSLPDEARELILARLQAAKASVKKYEALIRCTNTDGRLRGCLLFCGAQKTGRWCLTGDHEVLTPGGWVRLDEWRGGEIACWNQQNEVISFQRAGRVDFEYNGKMFATESKRCMQICTPDHKMPYLNKRGFWDSDKMENLAPRRFEMPYTGFRGAPPIAGSAELRVLIMTQADGHYTSDGAVRYHFRKARKIERCKALLRRAGIVFCVYEGSDGSTSIEIKTRYVPLWLRMFEDKTFGGWILDESPDVVFDELLHWDAYRCGPNSMQYSTTNKQNADMLQALAHLSGRAATLLDRGARKENWNTCYVLNIWLTPGRRHEIRREYTREIEFSGRVYCATTTTGFFMVRRNGVVWITGNSGRLFQPQNLPRGTLAPDQVETAIGAIKHGIAPLLYDDVNSVVSSCLRGAIIAPAGAKLVVADLSNIEGRVLAWLAGESWKLDAFRAYDRGEGVDLYKATYARTFGVKPADVTKKQRQIGKVLELAMGYMGGVGSFLAFATAYGVDLKELADHTWEALDRNTLMLAHDQWDFFKAKGMTNGLDETTWSALNAIKIAWRDAHPAITRFWRETEQQVEAEFGRAPQVSGYYPVSFRLTRFGLACRLPSGRVMAYPRAELPADEGERCLFKYYAPLKVRKGFAMSRTHAGKIVENCLDGAILTLTRDRGWVQLRKVADTDELFDGYEWVRHGGVVSNGLREVMRAYGEWMTPDHKVLTTEGFKNARESKEFDRYESGVPDGYEIPSGRRSQFDMGGAMCGLRGDNRDHGQRFFKVRKAGCRGVVRMHEAKNNFLEKQKTRHVTSSCVCDMAFYEGTMRNADLLGVQELRRSGNKSVRAVEQFVRGILGGHGADIQAGPDTGPNRQRRRLHAGQLPMGGPYCSSKQPPAQSHGRRRNRRAIRAARRREIHHHSLSACPRCPGGAVGGGARHYTEVFDVINCGPRNCFMVWAGGAPLIVHNCTQAVARDVLAANLACVEAAGYKIVLSVHDELITETPDTPGYTADGLAALMATPPKWAKDLPLAAAGFESYRYKKD